MSALYYSKLYLRIYIYETMLKNALKIAHTLVWTAVQIKNWQ